jgi:hypothetical protein
MISNQDDEPLGEIAHDGQPSVLNALALDGTLNVMRRFNRDTMVVATGLLGTVIFAALVLAVQEDHPLPAEVAKKAMQTTSFVDGFTPEINHAGPQANASSWSPAQRHDSARVLRPIIADIRHRSSTRLDLLT